MFCTNCGSSVEEDGNFCGSCGFRLDVNQPGFSSDSGAIPQNEQTGYNQGAGLPPIQSYFGNNSVNMQGQGYMSPVTPRSYSHSLTLALISIGIAIFSFLALTLIFSIIGLALAISALVLGATHLGKRTCAVGGFILGILFTLFYLVYFIMILSLVL